MNCKLGVRVCSTLLLSTLFITSAAGQPRPAVEVSSEAAGYQSLPRRCIQRPIKITVIPSVLTGDSWNYGVGISLTHKSSEALAHRAGLMASGDEISTYLRFDLENVQSGYLVLEGLEEYPTNLFVNDGHAQLTLWTASAHPGTGSRTYPGNRIIRYTTLDGCSFNHVIPIN